MLDHDLLSQSFASTARRGVNLGGWLLLEPGPSAPLSPGCSAGLGRLVNALDAAVDRGNSCSAIF